MPEIQSRKEKGRGSGEMPPFQECLVSIDEDFPNSRMLPVL